MTSVAVLTYTTLVMTGLVVLALVFYLTGILIALIRGGSRLAAIAAGLQAVEQHTDPLEDRLKTINGALGEIRDGLGAIDHQLVGIAGVFRL